MSVLPKIREKLNEEIRLVRGLTWTFPDDDFFKGRLNGLLWVHDRLLFNMKED